VALRQIGMTGGAEPVFVVTIDGPAGRERARSGVGSRTGLAGTFSTAALCTAWLRWPHSTPVCRRTMSRAMPAWRSTST
jgi:hypothetical protein